MLAVSSIASIVTVVPLGQLKLGDVKAMGIWLDDEDLEERGLILAHGIEIVGVAVARC